MLRLIIENNLLNEVCQPDICTVHSASARISPNVVRYLMDNELTTLPEGLFDDLGSISDL